MLKVRLLRLGRKNSPFYHVVVVDSRRARNSSAYLKLLGHYDPTKKQSELVLDLAELQMWLQRGAQVSTPVAALLRNIIKTPVHTLKTAPVAQ